MKFVEPEYDSIWNQANAKVHISLDGEKTICGRVVTFLWRKKEFKDFLQFGCKRCMGKVLREEKERAHLYALPILSLYEGKTQ